MAYIILSVQYIIDAQIDLILFVRCILQVECSQQIRLRFRYSLCIGRKNAFRQVVCCQIRCPLIFMIGYASIQLHPSKISSPIGNNSRFFRIASGLRIAVGNPVIVNPAILCIDFSAEFNAGILKILIQSIIFIPRFAETDIVIDPRCEECHLVTVRIRDILVSHFPVNSVSGFRSGSPTTAPAPVAPYC